jgi:hypothetical protein
MVRVTNQIWKPCDLLRNKQNYSVLPSVRYLMFDEYDNF